MNKIEKSMMELCPNGVEFKKLGEVCEISRGVRVVKSQLEKKGKYPVYQNCMTPLGYFNKKNCNADTTFVICGGAAGQVGYSDVDFWAADDCLYLNCSEQLQSKFLYYSLLCKQDFLKSQVRKASVPRLSRSVVEKIEIPVPPLAVQQEIVNILDKFTALEAELEAELEEPADRPEEAAVGEPAARQEAAAAANPSADSGSGAAKEAGKLRRRLRFPRPQPQT
jgi:restriction endonuclease S subunit